MICDMLRIFPERKMCVLTWQSVITTKVKSHCISFDTVGFLISAVISLSLVFSKLLYDYPTNDRGVIFFRL